MRRIDCCFSFFVSVLRHACLLFFFTCVPGVADTSTLQFPKSGQSDYVDYFSGITIILGSATISDSVRALRFRELTRLTGITPEQAEKFIASYKKKPRQWKKFMEKVVARIQKHQPEKVSENPAPE